MFCKPPILISSFYIRFTKICNKYNEANNFYCVFRSRQQVIYGYIHYYGSFTIAKMSFRVLKVIQKHYVCTFEEYSFNCQILKEL